VSGVPKGSLGSKSERDLVAGPGLAAERAYDLVVIGCGAAGLCAAVSYAAVTKERGRQGRIAVLERATDHAPTKLSCA
jgi:hypothetical protein